MRLVHSVGRGIRTPRGLVETLGVSLNSVQDYVFAGEWLGLLESQGDIWLTPLGLDLAFSGGKQSAVYARAVWAQPMVRAIMSGGKAGLPSIERLGAHIAHLCPDGSEEEWAGQAKSLRNLIAPGLTIAQKKTPEVRQQLCLPLAVVPDEGVGFDLSTVGKIGADPEVYRYFLSHLLDHGELSLAHVRALLDSALAEFVPLGDLVALAKTRGDAHQVDGRLVLTAGAVARKEVTGSVDSIILYDPTYRAYLTGLLAGSSAHPASPSLKAWHQRLFGGHQKPKALRHQLQQILLDRSLKSFPLAGDTGLVPTLTQGPFSTFGRPHHC